MAIERIFLGWDQPCLSRAAQWLRERYGTHSGCDLSSAILTAPAARAGRRFLEVLTASATAGGLLVPPQIVSIGSLPELLYPSHLYRIIDPLRALMARAHALRSADRDVLTRIVARPPADDDHTGWTLLAQDLERLDATLAAHHLSIHDVPERLERAGLEFTDSERWAALATLQDAYEACLSELGWTDVHRARRDALEQHRCATDRHVVLLGVIDPPPITRLMLEQAAAASNISVLVHAPEDEAENFDALGCPIAERWSERMIDLADHQVRIVDRWQDQGLEVLRSIGSAEDSPEAHSLRGQYTSDRITVGLGDAALAGSVARALDHVGIASRVAAGTPLIRSTPATLLRALGQFARQRRFDDFAALLRHPDLEAYLERRLPHRRDDRRHWLDLLDQYATDHLQGRLTGTWLGAPRTQQGLKAVYDAVSALLPPDADDAKAAGHWCDAIAGALAEVYGIRPLRRHDPLDHHLIEALESIGQVLGELSRLAEGDPLSPRLTFSQAIALLLQQLEQTTVAPPADPHAIELLGWLELYLDDALAMIVAGFNEGTVPESFGADAFLPDAARHALGLADSQQRYVRDAVILTTLLHSRSHLTLVAARRGADGSPLAPSRLTLARPDDQLPAVIRAFYPDEEQPAGPPIGALLMPHAGDASRFLIPAPVPPAQPIQRLRVTGFAAYLRCPYRFYLENVLRLRPCDDGAVELDPLGFGSLAHDVLKAFGRSDLSESQNADAVADFLNEKLDAMVHERFGIALRPALKVQVEQLRYRLNAFARRQASWAAEGWRIRRDLIEKDLSVSVTVDGEPFEIYGRVDRIDCHEALGYRVLDYKTGDSARHPDKTHRQNVRGVRTWVDLQLPLYRLLVAATDIGGPVQLGYINLPKALDEIDVALADWSEEDLREADEQRDQVIRALRAGRFWPPSEPAEFPDGFEHLCADEAMDRQAIINRSVEASR